MRLLGIFVLALILTACKKDGIKVTDNELLIGYGKTASKTISGQQWTVEFKSIIENSLCPKEATCVWAGRLVVSLIINGEEYILGIGDLQSNDESSVTDHVIIDGVFIFLSETYATEENATTKLKLVFNPED